MGVVCVLALWGAMAPLASGIDVNSWKQGMRITFTGYNKPDTLTNFPCLVVLGTNLTGFAYEQFSSPAGADLRFVDSNKTTELNYEIENWNTNGSSYVWVQVPRLVGTNTTIWAYWQNELATTAPAYTTNGSVWAGTYAAVWHFAETNGLLGDSAGNGVSGTANGGVTGGISGMAGNAFQWPNSTVVDSVNFGDNAILGITGTLSIQAWFKTTSGASQALLSRFQNGGDYEGYEFNLGQNGAGRLSYYGSHGWMGSTATTPYNDGEWHLMCTVQDPSTLRIFMDGLPSGSLQSSGGGVLAYAGANGWLGRSSDGARPFTGSLDEVRVSAGTLSADWIWASWATMASNAVFNSYDSVAFLTSGGLAIQNGPVTNLTLSSAGLVGYLNATGATPTTVQVYWGPNDGGTNAAAWANTNTFPASPALGTLTTNVGLSVSGITYFYRYYATNSAGSAWANVTTRFLAGAVTVVATAANTSEKQGSSPGVFTISRPSTATNLDLLVIYTLGGTAANGVDYATLNGSVTIPADASSATVTVAPVFDVEAEPSETVVLTLAAGDYVIGSPDYASVTIGDSLVFSQTAVNTWTGTGNWTNTLNWSQSRAPVEGDDVRIEGDVTLTNATPVLYAVAVNSGSLTFGGWDTLLIASNVAVNAGTVTHITQTSTNSPWTPDSRINIKCADLSVASGASIDAYGKGYKGAEYIPGLDTVGQGPGAALYALYGAGHGGLGAGHVGDEYYFGQVYGRFDAPETPGSGNGINGGPSQGGTPHHGGGVVRIDAAGRVLVDGTIRADGQSENTGNFDTRSGGASGGSIYITCKTISGNGVVNAKGGNAGNYLYSGGGGRIAVVVKSPEQDALPKPSLAFDVHGGEKNPYGDGTGEGHPGTLYITDASILQETWTNSAVIYVTNGTLSSLTISNATIDLRYPLFHVSGNARLLTNAVLNVYAGPSTNSTAYGALVDVAGDLVLSDNAWIYCYSDNTNGGSPYFHAKNLYVATNCGFNASGFGFAGAPAGTYGNGRGTGGGQTGNGGAGGGGYGGAGGNGADGLGGVAYGSSNAPTQPGSGGGTTAAGGNIAGGNGGGLIWIKAEKQILMDGSMLANGAYFAASANWRAGGGSGGGIYLQCNSIAGSGILRANGGYAANGGGGGGGGRIAVRHSVSNFTGTATVDPGPSGGYGGAVGSPGTIVWDWAYVRPQGTVISIR
jgi:hypothetical protein